MDRDSGAHEQLDAALRLLGAYERVRQAAVRLCIASNDKRRDALIAELEALDHLLEAEARHKRRREAGY